MHILPYSCWIEGHKNHSDYSFGSLEGKLTVNALVGPAPPNQHKAEICSKFTYSNLEQFSSTLRKLLKKSESEAI